MLLPQEIVSVERVSDCGCVLHEWRTTRSYELIPAWLLAVVYLVVAVLLVVTSRSDFQWARPPRLFLMLVMVSWSAFYVGVMFGADFQVLRALSRWLHLPTALAVGLIAVSRWYHERKWGASE